MAVKKPADAYPATIREFKERYRASSVSLIISLAIGASMLQTVVVLFMREVGLDGDLQVAISLIVATGLNIAAILILFRLLKRPLYEILAALAHKTGELTTTTPSNPNTKYHERTGLKHILQAIYDSQNAPDIDSKGTTQQPSLDAALNNTSCGIIMYDQEGRLIGANKAAPIAYTQEGEPFLALNFVGDDDIAAWTASLTDKVINTEKRWQRVGIDTRYVKKSRFYDVIASYERGARAEVVVVLVDQSDRYLPEEEDLNFIAFAAHELRGPITVIRGYLDILEQELTGRLTDDQPELLNRLSVSASRLSSYVGNILNVAKYDRHHLQTHLYEDTIGAIYATIADDMALRAQTQHRLLNISIPDDLPTVAADRGSISEVLGNLIDNAIKYSFEGGVIEVSATAKGDFVEVSVKDNGIGMPANVVSNLFRKFYRSHRSREAVAGTGIGLYISKAYVESHGGSIAVVSRENEGSTFTFTLPIYSTVSDKLLEDGQLNQGLVRKGGGWIKNHATYRR